MNTSVVNFVFESGFSLTFLTLVYLLLLRRETFFILNRVYLLSAIFFSVLLPFIHFQLLKDMPSVLLDEITITGTRYQNLLQTVTVYGADLSGSFEKTVQSIGPVRLIYLAGTVFFILVFLYRLFRIMALILNNESEIKDGIRIVKIDRDTTPFSFFSYVFVNRNNVNDPDMKQMLAHEMEHVRQRHSFDVMISEFLTIFQWFNPFIWLLKRSIRENHEFLADDGVLKPGVSSAAYRLLLLNSSILKQPVIANNFNYSLIKIRIKMITKIKSSKTAAIKLSMGIMVTAALLMIFGFDKIQDETFTEPVTTAINVPEISAKADSVYILVDQMPEFPGGESALRQFISREIKYPDDAKKAGIHGKVIVNFVVDQKGNVGNAKIIRGVSPSIDQESLRVINTMPKWEPGKDKGKTVLVRYTLPITFALK